MDCIRVTHPCAGRRQRYCYLFAAPRLACVRPVASVHPEPGSNSSLYLFFFFIIPSKRYLTELTSFSLISCTTLASSIPSMNLAKAPRGVPRFLFCGCKVNAFSYSIPNIFQCFFELFFYEMKTFSFSDCYN